MSLKRDGRLEIQRNLSGKADPEPIRPRVKSRPIERIPTSEYLEDADPAMLMMPIRRAILEMENGMTVVLERCRVTDFRFDSNDGFDPKVGSDGRRVTMRGRATSMRATVEFRDIRRRG